VFDRPIFVTRSRAPEERAFLARTQRIFASRWFTNDGEFCRELESKLQMRLDVEFCALFCNGTVALQAALRAFELEGEVITTPFTFPATAHAIAWNGMTPVFCDIDPETYNLDLESATASVGDRTRGIMPVHVFGNPCDVVGFEKLGRERGLRILYDAAHAFGVEVAGRGIGTFGDLSVFSFHATKLFHTAEGGAITGAGRDQLLRIRSLRNFGILGEEEVSGIGLNGKLSEVHAAVGLGILDIVDGEIEARRALAKQYVRQLSEISGLGFQRFSPETRRNYAYFTVEVDADEFGLTRDEVRACLLAENIISRKYFFPLCSDNESYRGLPSANPERLPNAHRLAKRILCLPLFGEMQSSDVERIAGVLQRVQADAPRLRKLLRGPTT
jgi:dTDP-4-amino-4,6-dideoxygalactose transaminase